MSVRAHLDYRSLATDVLLFDRLLLPYPNPDDRSRWEQNGWDPDQLDHVSTQSAGLIVRTFWSRGLREQFDAWATQVCALNEELRFGMTGVLYSSLAVHNLDSLIELIYQNPDWTDEPVNRPHVVAAFQSEAEAKAALLLAPVDPSADSAPQLSGGAESDIDVAFAVVIDAILDEPAGADVKGVRLPDEEVFHQAVALALDGSFLRARDALFAIKDRVHVENWNPADVAAELLDLLADHRRAVASWTTYRRRRRVSMVLPLAAKTLVDATVPVPRAGAAASTGVRFALSRMLGGPPDDPASHGGAALSMIESTYRTAYATLVPGP